MFYYCLNILWSLKNKISMLQIKRLKELQVLSNIALEHPGQ